jgi:hypothetical protein
MRGMLADRTRVSEKMPRPRKARRAKLLISHPEAAESTLKPQLLEGVLA